MPRAKKPTNQDTTKKGYTPNPAIRWLNIRLSPEQVQEVLALADNPNATGKAIASLLVRGVSFSVRANTDKENFSAFVTGITLSQVEGVFAISGFAPTALGAAASVLTKLSVLVVNQDLATSAQDTSGIG